MALKASISPISAPAEIGDPSLMRTIVTSPNASWANCVMPTRQTSPSARTH